MRNESATITLLTNIHFVQKDNSRFDCYALLIEQKIDGMFGDLRSQIRGFGTDGAWPVFTFWLDTDFTWTLEGPTDSRKTAVIAGDDLDDAKPLFSGSVLRLSTGERMFLQAEDDSRPLRVERVTNDYPKTWALLEKRVHEYWHAPNIPTLRWGAPRKGGRA